LSTIRLRDRDAIITREGLIFRVFGYSHPSNAYICDVEYAPSEIFKSDNPKAYRNNGSHVFCKFYEDEGWRFIRNSFQHYMLSHEMLQKKVIGVSYNDALEVRKPEKELGKLAETEPKDKLLAAMQNVLETATGHSGLSTRDFGVFGSMLHGFHHPKFSDIDIIIYGGKKTRKLCEMLDELYTNESSAFQNEFETDESTKGKRWRFQNLSPKEFVWHQRRKLIYGLFNDERGHRIIKVEFEPVKDWKEIKNEYNPRIRIVQEGWVKMVARVTTDDDTPFIPSVYDVEPLEVLDGPKEASEVERIVSYTEEFRMQVHKDEAAYVEGNLEEVTTSTSSFYQIALTYCPRYYEQVLKVNALT